MIDLVKSDFDCWSGHTRQPVNQLPTTVNNHFATMCSEPFFNSVDEARRALTSGVTTEQRVAAVRILAAVADELATTRLVGALFDDDDEVRQAAVQALSISSNAAIRASSVEDLFGREPQPVTPADLNHQEPQRRIEALATIGRLKCENAFELLRGLMIHPLKFAWPLFWRFESSNPAEPPNYLAKRSPKLRRPGAQISRKPSKHLSWLRK